MPFRIAFSVIRPQNLLQGLLVGPLNFLVGVPFLESLAVQHATRLL